MQLIIEVPSPEPVLVRCGEDPAGSRLDFVRLAVDTLARLD